MYLLTQMASYLFATFLLGVGVGYALWRSWGEREVVARYNAAEMRLAAHVARLEKAAAPAQASGRGHLDAPQAHDPRWEEAARRELHDFEVKQAALLREAEDIAIRKAEAAAERKLADLAGKLGYDAKPAGFTSAQSGGRAPDEPKRREPSIALVDTSGGAAAAQSQSKGE